MPLRVTPPEIAVRQGCFYPGRTLACDRHRQEYRFWEVGTWKPGLRIDRETGGLVRGFIAFTPDGQLMAVVKGFDIVQLLNWRTGEVLAELVPPKPQYIRALAFRPDGSVLAVVGQQAVHLWDLRELRRELAALKLDWNQPPFPASTHALGDVVFRPRHPASN